MGYCTLDSVRAAVAYRVIDGKSEPSAKEVTDFITAIASEIDGALAAQGYSVPVSAEDTSAYEYVGQVNVYGAAARVEAASPKGDDSKHRDHYRKLYDDAMTAIKEGTIVLADAARETATSAPRGGAGNPTAIFTHCLER